MDYHAPGIQCISRPGCQSTGQGDHERNLDRTGKSLPPDKNLTILNALLGVMNAVFRKKFYEGDTRPHIKESPGQVEELGYASPNSQGLGLGQDECRQDQVLINNERDEKYKPDAKGDKESTQWAMESNLLPFSFCFTVLKVGTVRDDLLQRLWMTQAILAHEKESKECRCQHEKDDEQQNRPVC
jgi:hypothetical protein